MNRRMLLAIGLSLLLVTPAPARHHHDRDAGSGLANATLLIIRHADKPDSGPGLSPAGEKRAKAYADYFRHFEIEGAPVHIDTLVATADSAESRRPRLTLEPLSRATGLAIQQPCEDKDVKGLSRWLAAQPAGRTTLIAWHHGRLPKLVSEIGGDPSRWLPGGEWPSSVYSWVLVLRYDANGGLVYENLVHEPEGLNR